MPEPVPSGPCVLALDVGSSSVRAGLYDASGQALAALPAERAAYGWTATPDGGMETDAERLFELAIGVLHAAVEGARGIGAEIAAVAVSGFWHSLVGVDADGTALTPVYGWGEMRSAPAALRLRERVDPAAAHARTGCFVHPTYPAAKLLWLREAGGATLPRATAWMSFGEYLELRLFGERRCSLSMASGTGLLDLRALRWDPEMLDAVGVRAEALSRLVDTDEPTPPLLREWMRRWPELAGLPWISPLGDGACANVGSGAVGGGRIGVSIGTSAAVRALRDGDPGRVPESFWCYRLDRRRTVTGRALSNAGNAVAWLRETLRLPPAAETEAALEVLEPDAHGLTVLPLLFGERAPGWERWEGASMAGLTQATRPVEILRAWLEAVAYGIAGPLDRLREELGGEVEVIASGGALHASSVWTGILADVLGCRVTLAAEREASSRGAALVALERLGVLADLADAPAPGGAVHAPDPDRHRRYRGARERQRRTEEALASLAPDTARPSGGE